MDKPDRGERRTTVRCAIYTRKSSDEGLDQEFNSLDAQREACEAYIISQKHSGWLCSPDMYDDGGLSGGTMERPALRRLLTDIAAGRVHTVVVYKVDRLTRSLADFAKIVDVLDAHDASFVSVTQQFNTTTSMGRLTLNMLLSFAQFEREIAGERIRDKIAASKAKGMWMGGNIPLGYDVVDRKLIPNETEAETVRVIFRRYAELGSVRLLGEDLARCGIVSKRREGSGGMRLTRGVLYTLLQNRIYLGEITHHGKVYPGQHTAILDAELWQTVQDRLATNRREHAAGITAEQPSLLAGLIVDAEGTRMTPTHAVARGKRYRYYISQLLVTGTRSDSATGRRVPAGDVEGLVLDRLRTLFSSDVEVIDALSALNLDASTLVRAQAKATDLAGRWAALSARELHLQAREIIDGVKVADYATLLHLKPAALLASLTGDRARLEGNPAPVQLTIAATLKRTGKEIRLVIGNGPPAATNDQLLDLLGDAFRTRESLLSGADETLDAMASRVGMSRLHITALIRLSYLSPQIVGAVIKGQQTADLTVARFIALAKDLPLSWEEQWRFLGFSSAKANLR